MKKINKNRLQTSKMMSTKAWSEASKKMEEIGCNKNSDSVTLSDGYIDFINIWEKDNGYCFEGGVMDCQLETVNGVRKEIRYCEDNDCEFCYEGDLDTDLTYRFSEFLQGD